MAGTSQGEAPGVEQHRVVLLSREVSAVPAERDWLTASGATLVVWTGQDPSADLHVPAPGRDTVLRKARVVGEPQGAQVRIRDLVTRDGLLRNAARLRSTIRARRMGVDPQWLWALKAERRLARDLLGSDLLIVLDAASEDALRAAPDLARGVPVIWPGQVPHVARAVETWLDICDSLHGHAAAERRAVSRAEIEDLASRVDELVEVPRVLRGGLPDRTEGLARRVWELHPAEAAAAVEDVLLPLVAAVSPEDLPRLAPARARAALNSGSWVPSEADLDQIVRHGFTRADLALASGVQELAIARFHEAMSLLLHRSRHAAVAVSPLASAPREFISPLTGSKVLDVLRGTGPIGGPAVGSGAVAARGRPRVLILPGSYGAFHQDLVDSLDPVAEVTAPALSDLESLFRRRRPSTGDLHVLAGLRAGEIDVTQAVWRGRPGATATYRRQLRALRHLWRLMSVADVVVSDWVDTGGLWASQVCPPGVRLVMRAHSLDIIDPWLHLVDWRTVDEVMISNDGFASIYRDLTDGTGAPHGVVVRPHRPDLPRWARTRTEDTRFTIGMVGWGRPAKDPAWGLDLLERDARRRLVLIGPGPGKQPYASVRHAMAVVEAKLRQPHLRDRVTIVGPTDDVAGHLGQVGVILSSSIREGWHLGLIEGAASGAVPVVRDWPMLAGRGGATSLFPQEWVVRDLDEADARLTALANPVTWRVAADRAQQQTLELFAPHPAAQAYRAAVLGTLTD